MRADVYNVLRWTQHYTSVTPEDIISRKRTSSVARARSITFAVLHRTTGMSWGEIGAEFGRVMDTARTAGIVAERTPDRAFVVGAIAKAILGDEPRDNCTGSGNHACHPQVNRRGDSSQQEEIRQ